MALTRRQIVTAAEMLFSDPLRRPTQIEVAKRFGVSQPAISMRLKGFLESLSDDQRAKYEQCIGRRGRKVRIVPMQLSVVHSQ